MHGVHFRPMNGVLDRPMHGSLEGGMYEVLGRLAYFQEYRINSPALAKR